MIKNNGNLITNLNDKRVTTFGKFLRKTKLDELPQIFNIILGDMNFIGPRPEVLKYISKNKFSFLKKIKPGLSDFSSILFRNEDIILSNIGGSNPYEKLLPVKLELAHFYLKKNNLILDISLGLITILSIIMPKLSFKFLCSMLVGEDLPLTNNLIGQLEL